MAAAADVASLLERATVVLDELARLDVDELSSDELSAAVLGCQRLRGTVDVSEARLVGRWDAERCWQPSGAKTGAAWLAWKQRLPIQVARQRIRHARAMRSMPEVEEAWSNGEIDRSHLTTLLGKRTARTKDAFETDHKELLDWARTERFSEFKRRCD